MLQLTNYEFPPTREAKGKLHYITEEDEFLRNKRATPLQSICFHTNITATVGKNNQKLTNSSILCDQGLYNEIYACTDTASQQSQHMSISTQLGKCSPKICLISARRPITGPIITNDRPKVLYKFVLSTHCWAHCKIAAIVHRRIPITRMPINHESTSLHQYAPSSSHIPRPRAALPEGILLASCNTTDRHSRRPCAPQRVHEAAPRGRRARQRGEHLEIELEVGTFPIAAPFNTYAGGFQALERRHRER